MNQEQYENVLGTLKIFKELHEEALKEKAEGKITKYQHIINVLNAACRDEYEKPVKKVMRQYFKRLKNTKE